MRLALRKSAERIVHVAFNRYLYFGFIACLLLLKYLLRGEYAHSPTYARFLDTALLVSDIAVGVVFVSLISCLVTLKWMKNWGDDEKLSWFKRIWRWNIASFVALPLVMYPGIFIIVAGNDWKGIARLAIFCILPGMGMNFIGRRFKTKREPSGNWISTADNIQARRDLILSTQNKYPDNNREVAKELGLSPLELLRAMNELGMPYKLKL